MEKTISELLGELEAKASPRPWWAHALTLSGPVKTIARFFGFDYAQGETDLAYTVLAANHLRPLVEALEAERCVDEAVKDCHNCYRWTSSGAREGRCEQHILAGHHARELRTKALAALHKDLEAVLKEVAGA